MVYKWSSFWVLPPVCLLCSAAGSEQRDICAACRQQLPFIRACCHRCSLPLAAAVPLCTECQQSPPAFYRSVCAFEYNGDAARLVQRFKYHRQLSAGRMLSGLLAAQLRAAYQQQPLPQAMLPVPSHWWRLLRRGYNPALEICRELSQALAVPVLGKVLRRRKHTQQQASLNRRQRLSGLAGAYAVKPTVMLPSHVALVDDVVTTGATVRMLAALLVERGVQRVDVWALARTPKG